MKKLLPIFLIAIVFASCSVEDDVSEEIHDISFSVESTDENRLSQIQFRIMDSRQDIHHSSYSNEHLPLTGNFPQQKVQRSTRLEIDYLDNSSFAVGETFEPYTVTLRIKVDSRVMAEKEYTITEAGQVEYVIYTF